MPQAGQPPPLQSAPKWNRWRALPSWQKALIIGAGVGAVLVLIGTLTGHTNTGTGDSSSGSGNYSIEVTGGSSSADIDVSAGSASTQANDQSLPWSENNVPFGFASVTATNGVNDDGSITCTIYNSDGSVRASNTATGPLATANCDTGP